MKVSAIWIFIPPRSRRQAFPLCALGGNASLCISGNQGNKLPKSIKLVFSLAEEKLSNLPNTKAAFLNILFKEHTILCTTAISQEAFSLDKSSERLWEEYILKFFKKTPSASRSRRVNLLLFFSEFVSTHFY